MVYDPLSKEQPCPLRHIPFQGEMMINPWEKRHLRRVNAEGRQEACSLGMTPSIQRYALRIINVTMPIVSSVDKARANHVCWEKRVLERVSDERAAFATTDLLMT